MISRPPPTIQRPCNANKFLIGLNKPHSNELQCVVHELSRMQSVFAICCGIQLRKYSCNVSQIWIFVACCSGQYITIRHLLYSNVASGSPLSRITHQSNSYISNNPSFHLKHPGVPDGSDGSGGTSYHLTENQTPPISQVTGRVAYIPCSGYYTMPPILPTRRVIYYARRSGVRLPLLSVRNVVPYTHH